MDAYTGALVLWLIQVCGMTYRMYSFLFRYFLKKYLRTMYADHVHWFQQFMYHVSLSVGVFTCVCMCVVMSVFTLCLSVYVSVFICVFVYLCLPVFCLYVLSISVCLCLSIFVCLFCESLFMSLWLFCVLLFFSVLFPCLQIYHVSAYLRSFILCHLPPGRSLECLLVCL